jgi:hypothetical protein
MTFLFNVISDFLGAKAALVQCSVLLAHKLRKQPIEKLVEISAADECEM